MSYYEGNKAKLEARAATLKARVSRNAEAEDEEDEDDSYEASDVG